jgi:hypothetical protein
MGGNPVTDNRWELAVVTFVAIAVFFSIWHLLLARLLLKLRREAAARP